MAIYQEVSRIESFNTTTGLVLSKRALESSVIVDDKQVAVLGGLIQDTFSDGSDRVPVLGDIPYLGALFRYDARKRQKVNLLIFLKPTVVRTDWQGTRAYLRALRLHHGRAAEEPAAGALFLAGPDRADASSRRRDAGHARRQPAEHHALAAGATDRAPRRPVRRHPTFVPQITR